MEEINFSHSKTPSDVRRDQNIRGVPVRGVPVLRELEGDRCANCGSLRYVLVFRTNGNSQGGTLWGRCTCCHEPRELTPSEIERESRGELSDH